MRSCFLILLVAALAGAASAGESDNYGARTISVVRVDARSGRLFRTVAAPYPAELRLAEGADHVPAPVEAAARKHNLDPWLVHSVIQVESNYNPYAVSPKGAQGLMQLMPATARRFGVRNVFDINENLRGGVSYLRYLLDSFGDLRLALAAYNAGEEAVERYRGIPPFRETWEYVAAVSRKYQAARRLHAKSDSTPRQTAEAVYRPLTYFVDEQGNLHIRTR